MAPRRGVALKTNQRRNDPSAIPKRTQTTRRGRNFQNTENGLNKEENSTRREIDASSEIAHQGAHLVVDVSLQHAEELETAPQSTDLNAPVSMNAVPSTETTTPVLTSREEQNVSPPRRALTRSQSAAHGGLIDPVRMEGELGDLWYGHWEHITKTSQWEMSEPAHQALLAKLKKRADLENAKKVRAKERYMQDKIIRLKEEKKAQKMAAAAKQKKAEERKKRAEERKKAKKAETDEKKVEDDDMR